MIATSLLSILSAASLALATPLPRQDLACNGHAELCDRSFGNVTFIGGHDSYAVDSDPLNLAANQNIDIPSQLSLGARLLQAQTHLSNGELHVCHTSCFLYDGGSLVDYLSTIATWLGSNPNEVLTLVVTNNDNVDIPTWANAFNTSGLLPHVHTPASVGPIARSDWPTLRELIGNDTRVVVFMDYGADQNTAPFIFPEFDNMWETPYDMTNSSFPCTVDRVNGNASGKLNMLNHFLDVSIFGALLPDRSSASTTNSLASVTAAAQSCLSFADGLNPSHILLDFVDKGDLAAAQDALNGF